MIIQVRRTLILFVTTSLYYKLNFNILKKTKNKKTANLGGFK